MDWTGQYSHPLGTVRVHAHAQPGRLGGHSFIVLPAQTVWLIRLRGTIHMDASLQASTSTGVRLDLG